MLFPVSLIAFIAAANALSIPRAAIKVVIGNDDGWATANIRTFYNSLKVAGFDPLISAPVVNKSGSSSFDVPAEVLKEAGQFGTVPVGAPATGADASDPRINYVNSFPVTAVKYGISTLAPRLLGGAPDIVLTGPNVGSNLGIVTQFSGTVGAATEAARQGIPAIAFSGAGGAQHSFTEPDSVAPVYAELAVKITNAVVASGKPYLPQGVALNVNFPVSDPLTCSKASDFKFVLSRVNIDINPFTDDVQHCGTNHLPTESSVISSGSCRVSISAYGSTAKFDVDKATQKTVRDKLSSLLSCM